MDEEVLIDENSKITIETDGMYIDKVSFFTSNTDKQKEILLDKYQNKTISEFQIRLYAETKIY